MLHGFYSLYSKLPKYHFDKFLEKCSKYIRNPKIYEAFRTNLAQEVTGNPEGYISVFRKYNKTFKEKANFDLFDFEECSDT